MKKFISLVFVVLLFSWKILFAQSSVNQNNVKSANRNTALRCLKLAESCLVVDDWENAVKQADLGLSYDENISDLLYVKAAAEINLGKTKADVIKILNLAFEKNEWVGYSKNGARIILADLLCDTGLYEQSLAVLDSEPLIFSADAEFIRIKNYYRIGNEQSINNARVKLNSSRRIYPNDERFPNLFFMFETYFLNEAEKLHQNYEIPQIVKTISSAYIAKLPDYSGKNTDLEIMATFFADDETKTRLISAIDAKNQTNHPLLAIAALKSGLYAEEQAVDFFFTNFDDEIPLNLLEDIIYLVKSPEMQEKLIEKLSDFTGTIIIDENFDLQSEITVYYEKGRPSSIKYDKNNDGELELYSTCDFGAPNFVHYYENKSEVFYDGFPKVSKVNFIKENCIFKFIHDDFTYAPYILQKNKILESFGVDFYVPLFNGNVTLPELESIGTNASSVELPVAERDNAKVIFTLNENELVFATYFEGEKQYATCDFSTGFPYTRYVDYDNDNYFETLEIYDIIPEPDGFDLPKEEILIQNVFTHLLSTDDVYLKKILIDRNGNTNYEFSEQYIEYNGKITLWDNDDNGIWDCQTIRYPQKSGENLIEETIFYEDNGLEKLILKTIDTVPVKMTFGESEVMIYAGSLDNFYWIENEGTLDQEKQIIEYFGKGSNGITQGAIDIIQLAKERISVIKVNQNIYCRILPTSDVLEINED